MDPRRDFQAGDPPPGASWWNGLLRHAKRTRLAGVGSGLSALGGALSRLRSPRLWAKLSGNGPVYGFAEATPNASGGFDLVPGGRTDAGGEQPAYEANGGTGLHDTYQRLRFSAAGDWRFQDIRLGTASHGGGCTAYCVQVTGQGTTDPSGIAVTIAGYTLSGTTHVPWSTSGSTGSDGKFCYTLPTTGTIPHVTGYTVTNPCTGSALSGGFYGGSGICTGYFTYCKLTVRATITPAAAPTVTVSPLYMEQTTSGSTVTFTYCSFGYMTAPFPATLSFEATSDNYGYPPVCRSIAVNCGDDVTVDLTQGGDFSACYFPGAGCDLGCGDPVDWGKGPSYRGLIPRTIECQWNSGGLLVPGYGPRNPSNGNAGPIPYFADDEGQWITIPGAASYDAFGNQTGLTWDTGCRDPRGNFQGSTDTCGNDSYLNYDPPYERLKVPYQATQITITPGSVAYVRHANPDCSATRQYPYNPGCQPFDGFYYACGCCGHFNSDTGYLTGDCATGVSSFPAEGQFNGNLNIVNPIDGLTYFNFQRALFCSPVDMVVGMVNYGYGPNAFWASEAGAAYYLANMQYVMWYVRIREVAC